MEDLKNICKAFNLGDVITKKTKVSDVNGYMVTHFETAAGKFKHYFKIMADSCPNETKW